MHLIGREAELAALVERLGERRLVTVIGPGGIGKTSLAMAAASVLADRYPLGCRLVDLTRVDTPDAVGPAMAAQLGFPSFDALLDAPTDQPALLVVDNCEHVLAAAAIAVARLLEACPSPTVVATSRSPLDVPGESLITLGPLATPVPGSVDRTSSAVQLFVERARHAGVEVADDDLESAGALCRELDGVPLAIELAAARTRSMAVRDILTNLRARVDVLTRPTYRGASRHRSLADTVAWSYRLLDPTAQGVFRRLSVVNGPFDVDTVADLALEPAGVDAPGPGATPPPRVHDVLAQLVDASLVTVTRDSGATSYRLLHPVRAYAESQLDESGERDALMERFCRHVGATVRSIMAEGRGGWSAEVLGRLLGQYDNVAAAIRWTVAHDTDPTRTNLLYSVLWGVVHQAHVDEIVELGELVAQRWPDPSLPFGADAAATASTARFAAGDVDGAVAVAEAALPVAGSSVVAPITLRRTLARAAHLRGDDDGALNLFELTGRLARDAGIRAMAMEADVFRALVLSDLGRTDEALALVRTALAEARASGSEVNEAWALEVEGHVLLGVDPDAAAAVLDEAVTLSRRHGYASGMLGSLRRTSTARFLAGDLAGAAAALSEALDELAAGRARLDTPATLHAVAVVLERAGRPGWPDLAATAAARAPVGALRGLDGLPLPDHAGRSLPLRDAVALARRELREVAQAPPHEPPSDLLPDTSRSGEAGARAAAAVPRGRFARRGDYWELDFDGVTVHVKPSKGMDDLARLLGSPGREIHCTDLAGVVVQSTVRGEVLDERARREYEDRVRDLQAEIDEAERHHDPARAERAQTELDHLVDHLTAALGLGRTRRTHVDEAERARSAVTQRIRSTIRRIGDAHPALGRHLVASVTTGTFCCYRPERAVDWTVGR